MKPIRQYLLYGLLCLLGINLHADTAKDPLPISFDDFNDVWRDALDHVNAHSVKPIKFNDVTLSDLKTLGIERDYVRYTGEAQIGDRDFQKAWIHIDCYLDRETNALIEIDILAQLNLLPLTSDSKAINAQNEIANETVKGFSLVLLATPAIALHDYKDQATPKQWIFDQIDELPNLRIERAQRNAKGLESEIDKYDYMGIRYTRIFSGNNLLFWRLIVQTTEDAESE